MADSSGCGALEGLSDELVLQAFSMADERGYRPAGLPSMNAKNSGTADMPDALFPRLDDFTAPSNESQMMDLTNSLPKHQSVSLSTQAILAKLENHDEASRLQQNVSGPQQSHRKLEAEFFSVVCNSDAFDETHTPNNQSLNQTLEPTDVYGRVTCYDGKIVLQLRLLNLNTNFPINVSECWLCRNKVPSGTPLYAHKHMFSGVFQVSDEYIHLIIPEPETESDKSMFNNSFDRPPSPADFTRHLSATTDLDLRDELDSEDNLTLPYIVQAFGLDDKILEQGSNVSSFSGGKETLSDDPPDVDPPLHAMNSVRDTRYGAISSADNAETRALGKDVNKWEAPKHIETGARKRKSKARKKPSVIRMRDDADKEASFFTSEASSSNNELGRIRAEDPNKSLRKISLLKSNTGQTAESTCTDSTLVQQSQKLLDANFKLVKRIIAKTENVTCKVCKARFGRNLSGYKQHMINEHSCPVNSLYECPVCLKKFSMHKYLVEHVKIHLGVKPFKCDRCGTTYGREETLKRHILAHEQKKPHMCSICPKAFSRAEYLKAHIQAHNRVRFSCNKCNTACSSKFNLEMHMRKHWDEKPFVCELCSKSFLRSDKLDTHMEVVHKTNKPKCNVCGKTFARKDILKRHMSSHQEASFDCSYCAKSFTRRDRLLSHKRTHEISRALKCSKCPASFNRRELLMKHQQLHEAREQCHVCHKFFKTMEKLSLHLKCHRDRTKDRHSCEMCGKTFVGADLLQKHLRRVHGWVAMTEEKHKVSSVPDRIKSFVCDICSKAFTRSCNLRAHVLKVHSKKSIQDEQDDEDDPVELDGLNSALSKSRCNQRTLVDLSCRTSKHRTIADSYVMSQGSPLGVSAAHSLLAASSSAIDTSMEGSSWYPRPDSASPAPHLPSSLSLPQLSSQHSPINLSAEAITAAAYLLAYPSYLGPYQ